MTDKIRIVGEFGDSVVDAVNQFSDSLTGVETVQVLRNGVDIYPHPEEEAHAADHALPPSEPDTSSEPAPEPSAEPTSEVTA